MPKVYGSLIDTETRCRHYFTEEDIIAIKFKCCNKYYPCYKCHNEFEKHAIKRWSEPSFNEKAILCGVCKHELTIVVGSIVVQIANLGLTIAVNITIIFILKFKQHSQNIIGSGSDMIKHHFCRIPF